MFVTAVVLCIRLEVFVSRADVAFLLKWIICFLPCFKMSRGRLGYDRKSSGGRFETNAPS